MVKECVSLQDAVAFLNELLEIDREAISQLFSLRVPCNKHLAEHPTVQVSARPGETVTVGVLGILNGLFGVNKFGWGQIAMAINNETMEIEKFLVLSEDFVKELVEKKLHEKLGNSHPKLSRGQVWCRVCGRTKMVDPALAMKHGWPKCCGQTMTIDSPEEQAER